MKKFIRSKKSHFFSFLMLLGAVFSREAVSETFRVRKVTPLDIQKITDAPKAIYGINDAVLVTLPDDLTFISGVELTIKIPEEIATWRDSVAYSFYDNVVPSPSEKNVDYNADKLFLKTLPSKLSLTLDLPVADDFSKKETPYSVKVSPMPDYRKGIFMRFQLVMKGVPESLENSLIEVSAKPVLRNSGILSLKTTPPQSAEKNYSVFIDDTPVQNYGNLQLETGEHRLSIVSDAFRNEVRTFRIEQAKTTVLEVSLRGSEPLLKLVCPQSAQILIDDRPFVNPKNSFVIAPGDHTVKFSLGDYEVVKTLTAVTGRSYTISLDIEASLSEED